VQLERAGAGLDLLDETLGPRGVALAGEGEVHRKGLRRLEHALDVPGAGRAGRRVGAGGRSGAAAQHGGHARHQRFLDLLGADEVDMRVDGAGGDDSTFAGDRLGAGTDDDRHVRLDVGIAGLADAGDATVLDADIGLDDPPMVDDQRIGDDRIDGAGRPRRLALPHAVPDHLAAAELDLLAIGREVALDLDDEVRVGEPHPVARRRPEHVGIGGARHLERHQRLPITPWRKP
jgi:hypothetical protein